MKYKVRVRSRETWISDLPESLKHEFSMEELEQMQQQFCDFDESGGGSIAASELVVLMKSMGIDATLDEVQALIDKVDDNHSGELEFHEFVRLVSEFRRGDSDKLADFIQYSKLVLAIRKELLDLVAHPTKHSRVRPVKENAWEWNVDIDGPVGTPYEGGSLAFRITFSRDYPYEAPSLACLSRIYHPNFVPLLNGTISIPGFESRWELERRMRGFLERVEQLLTAPDVDLMTAFLDDSEVHLAHSNASTSPSRRMRHPRENALECIDLYVTHPDKFFSVAKRFTASHQDV